MKTRNILNLYLIGALLSLALDVQSLKSQNVPATITPDSIYLTGSTLKAEDLISKSDAIFIGEITEMGFPNPSSPGVASYGVKVKVLQVLRGSVGTEITVKIDTFAVNHEGPPKAGNSYIIFVRKEDDRNRALKLLPATDDNIAKVKALIAAAPASK